MKLKSFIISILVVLGICFLGSKAYGLTLTLTEEDNWNRPFKEFEAANGREVYVYCNEEGKPLGRGTHVFNRTGDGHFKDMTAAYAKRLYNGHKETDVVKVNVNGAIKYRCYPNANDWQGILWRYPISTTATAGITWTNPKNPKIEFDNDSVSKKVESIDDDYYRIAFKLNFSGGGTHSDVTIKIKDESGNVLNCNFEIYTNKSCTNTGAITSGDTRYIKIKKKELDSYKKIKLYATYSVADKYSGKFVNYIEGNGTSNNQHLVGVYVDKEPSEAKHSTSRSITVAQPRLVTTKYIKKITSANGKELYNIPDSWNSNDWDAENLKPIVKVNTNKGVTESGRYELTKQNARNFNITAGDVITYNIRVYNVGNDDADLTDESLESVNKDGDGIIYKNGYVYDNPDDHLEFVDKDINDNKYWEWDSSEGAYRAKATNLKVKKSRPSDTIESYEKASDNINRWSGVMQIDFKVTGDEQASFKIKNNGLTAQREDATVKFLKSVTTKDKDGNDVETVFDKEPEVEVDTSKKVGEDNRIIINTNTPDVTVMDGDTLTYCMRYYSTALNKTELNYKAIDKFRRRVRI